MVLFHLYVRRIFCIPSIIEGAYSFSLLARLAYLSICISVCNASQPKNENVLKYRHILVKTKHSGNANYDDATLYTRTKLTPLCYWWNEALWNCSFQPNNIWQTLVIISVKERIFTPTPTPPHPTPISFGRVVTGQSAINKISKKSLDIKVKLKIAERSAKF